MRKKISLAIIGCGNIASNHIEAFNKLGLSTNHCASRLNSTKVKRFATKYKIKNVWKDPVKLAKNSKSWDGIVLSSSTKSIPKILEILIKQKKPVLVEKPVSIGTKYLSKFKLNSPKFVSVGFNRRFYNTVVEAKKFVKESKGQVLCNMKLPVFVKRKNSEIKKFNNIFENAVHGIDTLRYIFGDLEVIYKNKIRLNNFDSGRFAVLKSKKKHICNLIINSNSPDNFSLEIENGIERLLLRPFEKCEIFRGIAVKEPNKKYPLRSYSPKLIRSSHVFEGMKKFKNIKPGFFKQGINFYNKICGSKTKSSANLTDAYKAQKILETIM